MTILQGVYVYHPLGARPAKATGERPSKRRKVKTRDTESQQQNKVLPFVPLLNGHEAPETVQLRYNTYNEFWSKREVKIQVSLLQTHTSHDL